MNEQKEVSPNILKELGLDPNGFSIDWYGPQTRILKVVGRCDTCGLIRQAFMDRETGDKIPVRCPKPGQIGRFECFWGGQGALPIGED